MADATKFRSTIHHQSNELVALEWIIEPLNEQLDVLHAKIKQYALPKIALEYQAIAGVLKMANLSCFVQLSHTIAQVATCGDCLPEPYHLIVYASKLLQYELNHYVLTGFLHETLINLRIAYLQANLPNMSKQDLSKATALLFSDKISIEFDTSLSLPDFIATEQAWQDVHHYIAKQPLSQCQEMLIKFKTHLATLAVPHSTPIFAKLWKISALWLSDLPNNSQTDIALISSLFDELYQAISLQKSQQHIDPDIMLWLDVLVADIYIALASFAHPSTDTRQLLECLDDDYLVEKAFFIYVVATLQVLSTKDVVRLTTIKNRLISRGWLHYCPMIDELSQTASDTWQIKCQQLCTSLTTLHHLLDIKTHQAQPSILSQSYQALECVKRQFAQYLRSKNVADLPTPDELYRLSYAFEVIPLNEIVHAYQQLADIFVQLSIKAPKRISWQLAHKVADSLMLFEAFLDGLARYVFDHDALVQTHKTITQTQQMIETLADDVDEIFDIYARLLKAHESMVLYDDVGSHEPVVGEIMTTNVVSNPIYTDNIEEADITEEMLDVVQPTVQVQQRFVAPPAAALVNDNFGSQDVFLTDILSAPNLSLGQTTQMHNDIQAVAAYAIKSDDDKIPYNDEALIEDLLSKGLFDENPNKQPSIVPSHPKLAEPLSVYQEFIEESNQVNDNQNIDMLSQIDPSSTHNTPVLSEAYLAIKESLKEDDFSYDEEFREIFIEEVDEVMQQMHEALPKWQSNIADFEALGQIRRNFHTLKGSGRMVGAFQIGEMAWAIENLLNRVLDKAIEMRQEIVDLVTQTAAMIPMMVQDFARMQAPSVDNVKIILQANNILANKPMDEGVSICQPSQDVKDDKEVATAPISPVKTDEMQAEVDHNQIILPEVLMPFMEQASRPLVSVFADADSDIKAIFIEEAEEILTQLIPQFVAWRQNQQPNQLMDIRCAFHALKGSARMVGAAELGELAWSIENLLNHIMDGSIALNESMVMLMSDVVADFGRLVGLFESGVTDYPEYVTLWMACANAYSQGHGDEFDYRAFGHFVKQSNLDWSPDIQESQQEVEITTPPPCQSAEALGFIQEAKAIILNATPKTPHDEEEEMLCQIFIEEGRELLADVKAFLQENQHKDSVAVNDKIVRAFHTLRGASGLSSLALVGEVGAVIERGLQSLQQHDAPMKATHLQALGNAVELIEAHLTAYEIDGDESSQEDGEEFENGKHNLETLLSDDAQEQISDIGALIEGIDTLLDAELELETVMAQSAQQIVTYANKQLQDIELLASRTLTLPKFQTVLAAVSSAYQLIASHPDCTTSDGLVDALLATHHQLIGLFDSLAGSMSLKVDEATLQELSVQQTNYLNQALQTPLPTHSNKAFSKKVILDELSVEHITTDDELLEIFLSQAQDVLVSIGQAIIIWQNDLSDTDQPKTLLRDLQTLSGGASLAQVPSISQLADAMCVLLEYIQNQKIIVSHDWLSILEQMYDILVLQVGSVQASKQSFFVDDTIVDLQKHLSAGTIKTHTKLTTPVIEVEVEETVPEFDETEPDEPIVTSSSEEVIDFKKFIADSWHGTPPDADILEVFLEEAKDLAESSGEDFAIFRNNTGDIQTLQSLQRKLHTIKGGARMVSANGVADLAHEMETIYEDLGNHRYPANQSAVSLLFACHDWIVAAVHLLKSHYNPPRPTLLIDALHQFIQSPESVVAIPTVSLENEAQMLARYHEIGDVPNQVRDIAHMPPAKGVFAEKVEQHTNAEMIRISAPLMEQMINLSGETAINRARIDMSVVGLTASIEEMGVTVQRLADQLRRMDIELEAQILAQIDDADKLDAGFDPLEMDQYSALNQLSKSLSESASDLLDIKTTLLDKTRNSESLLLQLSRTQTQLQDKLMGSRMVPFSRLTPRLHRIVRQTANELGKMVELTVINADGEVDRAILEHMTSPLEHMLRNAVDHGIEFAEQRSELGKSAMGHITLQVQREGNELVVVLSDDGAGINVDAVRQKIIKQGLIRADDNLSDNDVMQYIFNAGLSTANKVTQISGRGVGMDVVRTEIRQLGGAVSVESSLGKGSTFTIRVPLVVALSDVLIVRVADHQYAIPLVQIERVVQVETKQLLEYYQSGSSTMALDGQEYRLRYLNEILANHEFNGETLDTSVPVVIAKTQIGTFALQVDEIVGSRMEVVAKPLGNQLSRLSGISAATIMGDGSVMLILDLPALMRTPQRLKVKEETLKPTQRHLVMVVDDSVTVRKVTSRFLERQGFDVVVAKDGVHAVEILQETIPDLMLLDIEMPRMDGFEVATQVRHSPRLQNIPIIMITSRTGEKHRQRAFEIGVNAYLGKPFQEMQLLLHIHSLLNINTAH